MFPFKTVMACLDLSEMDDQIISSINHYGESLGIERLYFVHVTESEELPQKITDDSFELVSKIQEDIKTTMQKKLQDHLGLDFDYTFEVVDGNPSREILRLSRSWDIDLIILGKKNLTHGTGINSGKIVKICPCSVLFIPQDTPLSSIKKIMVPVDFSEHSKLATEVSRNISLQNSSIITLKNIYRVPTGYHTTGKSFEAFAEIMKRHAEKECKSFLQECNLDPQNTSCEFVLDKKHDPSKLIKASALKGQTDLIVIGSKGRKNLSSLLLGSVAEKLTKISEKIPVLVVKMNDENMGFVNALLKL